MDLAIALSGEVTASDGHHVCGVRRNWRGRPTANLSHVGPDLLAHRCRMEAETEIASDGLQLEI
jgi:hypothetical protein